MTNQFSNVQNPNGERDVAAWVLMRDIRVCLNGCGRSDGQVARRAGLVARATLRNGRHRFVSGSVAYFGFGFGLRVFIALKKRGKSGVYFYVAD